MFGIGGWGVIHIVSLTMVVGAGGGGEHSGGTYSKLLEKGKESPQLKTAVFCSVQMTAQRMMVCIKSSDDRGHIVQ